MDPLKTSKDAVEFVAKTSARILDVLQRTTIDELSPEEKNLLEDV